MTQHSNLSRAENLLQLSKCTDIVIKPADKGGAVVIWSCPLYIAKATGNHQQSDVGFYEHLDRDPIKENQHVVKMTVNMMIDANQLRPSVKHLIVPSLKTSQFYLLPKIHKPNNPEITTIVSA